MLERLQRSSEEDECESSYKKQKEQIKGILCDNEHFEDIVECLDTNDTETFVLNINVTELNRLSEMECYEEDIAHSDALTFANRWESSVECYVRVVDAEEEISVEIEVVRSKNVTNEMVRDFSRRFRTNIHANFDPLAEEHEEPHLSIHPF